MKKGLGIFAALAITATASAALADPLPLYMNDYQRVRADAQLVVQKTQELLNVALSADDGVVRGGWAYDAKLGWRRAPMQIDDDSPVTSWYRDEAIAALAKLNQSARAFLTQDVYHRSFFAKVRYDFRKLERRFVMARRVFPWLRPSPVMRGLFAELQTGMADMTPIVHRFARPAMYYGVPRTVMPQSLPQVQPPPPPPAPPAPVTYTPNPPATVYNAGFGFPQVTFYRP